MKLKTRALMQPRSLAPLLILALICTTVTCLVPFFIYTFTNLKTTYYDLLKNDRKIVGQQATESLSIPMYNLDTLQINEVIKGFMNDSNIYRITVTDYYPPHTVLANVSRDENWGITSPVTVDSRVDELVDRYRIVFQQREVGALEIEFSDKFIRGALYKAVVTNILALILLTITLSIAMFIVLRRTVIIPLREVERFAIETGKDEFSKVTVESSKYALEIRHVHEALESMLSQLRSRFEVLMRSEKALRESEQRLQQSQKMEAIGTLAGGIAHDFNNILGAILGHTEMLLLNKEFDPKSQDSLKRIQQASMRARDLVKQILAFSRQSQQAIVLTEVDSIMIEVAQLLRSSIPPNIDFELRLGTEGWLIEADPSQMHQVIMNLCTNAYHAMGEEGGQLNMVSELVDIIPEEIEHKIISSTGKYTHISIQDSGQGIAPEVIDKIFDPFFTTKEQGKGTGMGLAVAYGIIKDMDGEIIVESVLDEGTTFHLYLPVYPISAQQADNTEHKSLFMGNGEHVLLVDDDVMLCDITKQTLEEIGYKVSKTNSSIEALERVLSNPEKFDLLLTDYYMPKMVGIELIKQIRAEGVTIPIVLYTGFSEKVDEKRVLECGGNAFVHKPVSRIQLSRILRRIITTSRK